MGAHGQARDGSRVERRAMRTSATNNGDGRMGDAREIGELSYFETSAMGSIKAGIKFTDGRDRAFLLSIVRARNRSGDSDARDSPCAQQVGKLQRTRMQADCKCGVEA